MLPVFDPQDSSCKTPFGAVPCGTTVTFTLRDETYYACELLVRRENGQVETIYAGEVSVRGIYGYV